MQAASAGKAHQIAEFVKKSFFLHFSARSYTNYWKKAAIYSNIKQWDVGAPGCDQAVVSGTFWYPSQKPQHTSQALELNME